MRTHKQGYLYSISTNWAGIHTLSAAAWTCSNPLQCSHTDCIMKYRSTRFKKKKKKKYVFFLFLWCTCGNPLCIVLSTANEKQNCSSLIICQFLMLTTLHLIQSPPRWQPQQRILQQTDTSRCRHEQPSSLNFSGWKLIAVWIKIC